MRDRAVCKRTEELLAPALRRGRWNRLILCNLRFRLNHENVAMIPRVTSLRLTLSTPVRLYQWSMVDDESNGSHEGYGSMEFVGPRAKGRVIVMSTNDFGMISRPFAYWGYMPILSPK